MASHQAPKKVHGTRNDVRRSGKAWKDGKSPEIRLAEAKRAAVEKRARKATQS
jgi:hypothetical protein